MCPVNSITSISKLRLKLNLEAILQWYSLNWPSPLIPAFFSQLGSVSNDKRAHHNALERKRRDHIKDSFCKLRDAIPSLQGDKLSR